MPKQALLLVDLQNDFCPGGNLAVPQGDEVMAVANWLQPLFELVVASKDWHPYNHVSFASMHAGLNPGDKIKLGSFEQVLWPDHCVQDTEGADFHPELLTANISKIVYKGIDPEIDSYSAFFDNHGLRATGLADYLKEQGVEELWVMGLATDYCVKFTCQDAIQQGFKVNLIEDGCRGIELRSGDIAQALADLKALGVRVVKSPDYSKTI